MNTLMLSLGVKVTVLRGDRFNQGCVALDHKDGTFDIDYDNGDKEIAINEEFIELVPKDVVLKDDASLKNCGLDNKGEIENNSPELDIRLAEDAVEKLSISGVISRPVSNNVLSSNILTYQQLVFHEDPTFAQQLKGTQELRKLLSIASNPPINDVIDAGVVPYFVLFMQMTDQPLLQFEAAWAMTNIARGTSENTRVVIDAGAVPIFIQLLSSPNEDVREQAAWALGNVAGGSMSCRDLVLSLGALPALLLVAEGWVHIVLYCI